MINAGAINQRWFDQDQKPPATERYEALALP
jgi:hypothetical protein